MSWNLPLAAAGEVTRHVFEWGRIQSNADWILPIAVCLAILLFVRWMYRRDGQELHPVLRWLLTILRTATFLGLLVLYLEPQWRTERETVRNSRALVLVDTSLSMGLPDADASSAAGRTTRADRVVSAFTRSNLLDQLRRTHDVTVMPFSENLDRDRGVTLAKKTAEPEAAADPSETPAKPVDWAKLLAPLGTETRLGQALRQVIYDERNTPVSGVVVFSDGGQNAGIAPDAAIDLAREAKIPVFTIGLGSNRKPLNVRVSDFVAPSRAYPGDRYSVTGFLQSQGLAGQSVRVEILSRPAGSGAAKAEPGTGRAIAGQQVTLGGDGEILPVKFELTPDQTGQRTLTFRVAAPATDQNPADNFREADIEIVDRKNHVLLLAGGPTREYQFLRTQLYRDRSTKVDVVLQTGQPGISQEASKILDHFPSTREEMYAYDCVVAFDPDWQSLTPTQIDLLENWVGEQGGGLITIAGPVFMGKSVNGWVQDQSSAMAKVRGLYPVEFQRRFSGSDTGMSQSKEPWPLDFTREGLESEYLWLADTATAGRQAWAAFEGVYSFYPVRGPKPGAAVLARFSDPRAAQGGQQPVYLAEQFYGSGRVFYLGSGEMWRLRKYDDTSFEQLYTKLIRHVSQGRLLRGSTRGVLLVGQDRYLLGDTAEVRAQLTNARLEPLTAAEVPMQVIGPDGTPRTITLRPDPSRVGTFAGRFPVLLEGAYRLELSVPESDNERLTRRIYAKVPDLERENPQRNDALLSRIAKETAGRYYVGVEAAVNSTDQALVKQLKDRTDTLIVPTAPSPEWEEEWLRWLMYGLCGLLCVEWLIRRLVKLA